MLDERSIPAPDGSAERRVVLNRGGSGHQPVVASSGLDTTKDGGPTIQLPAADVAAPLPFTPYAAYRNGLRQIV
jgi:hypothetical protein